MTMKKTYIVPAIELLDCMTEDVIAVSTVDSDSGIGYSGIDEIGLLEPASRFITLE